MESVDALGITRLSESQVIVRAEHERSEWRALQDRLRSRSGGRNLSAGGTNRSVIANQSVGPPRPPTRRCGRDRIRTRPQERPPYLLRAMLGRVPRRIPFRSRCAIVTLMNLIGRDAERAHLAEFVRESWPGRGGALIVCGPGGSGDPGLIDSVVPQSLDVEVVTCALAHAESLWRFPTVGRPEPADPARRRLREPADELPLVSRGVGAHGMEYA